MNRTCQNCARLNVNGEPCKGIQWSGTYECWQPEGTLRVVDEQPDGGIGCWGPVPNECLLVWNEQEEP
jgi:hypothetical protein